MKLLLSIFFSVFVSSLLAQKQEQFTVNFDFNRSEITAATASRLDSFAHAILSRPGTFSIALYGHCDSIGSNDYNDALSQKRAEAVKNYLAQKGVASSAVVKEQGFGKRQPLNDNNSEKDRFLNRRVEVVVTITEPIAEKPIEKPVEKPVEKTEEKSITRIIEDSATTVGTKVTLRNLNFIGGRHYLLPESAPILQELLTVMNNNPKLEISIEGHVCCVPDFEDGVDLDLGTKNLSVMRAKSVYDFLVKNGISPKRLTYKGFGHSAPLAPFPEKNSTEMANNRRVEIKIINK